MDIGEDLQAKILRKTRLTDQAMSENILVGLFAGMTDECELNSWDRIKQNPFWGFLGAILLVKWL